MYEFMRKSTDGTVYNYGGCYGLERAKREIKAVYQCLKNREMWHFAGDLKLACTDGSELYMREIRK